jgi:alpha-N-arabinofuranosidase
MDGLGWHYYTRLADSNVYTQEDGNEVYVPVKGMKRGSAIEFDEKDWFGIMKSAWRTDEIATKHSTLMDKYDPSKKVALIIDEWGTWFDNEPGTNPRFLYQQNTLRDAVSAAISLNIFNSHADRLRMANIAQTVNVLQAMVLTEGAKMVLTPSYHVFDLFKDHQDGTLLPSSADVPAYNFGGEALPGLSASASKNKDGDIIITLVNPDPDAGIDLAIDIRPLKIKNIKGKVLSAKTMQDYNDFTDGNKVRPENYSGAEIRDGAIRANVPSKSVILLVCSEK